jgi:hypothetical protein
MIVKLYIVLQMESELSPFDEVNFEFGLGEDDEKDFRNNL